MSSRKLDRLNIDPKICNSLDKIGIKTARDLIEANIITIMTSTDLSLQDAKNLINTISEKITGKNVTAFDILNERLQKKCYLSTGISLLDEAMRGGLLVGCINEIVGPPGIGKTQFSLGCCIELLSQHLLHVGFENINSSKKCGIIYFDTELKFDSKRLREMAMHKFPRVFKENLNGPHLLDWLLSRVILKRPSSCKELLEDIESLQALVISEGISMIVLDSVAALPRKEGLTAQEKEGYIIRQAAILKKISEICECVVLCTNQIFISNTKYDENDVCGDKITDGTCEFKPFLGSTWHHCVTTRLVMKRIINPYIDDSNEDDRNKRNIKSDRVLVLTKSPIAPTFELSYLINDTGIVSSII